MSDKKTSYDAVTHAVHLKVEADKLHAELLSQVDAMMGGERLILEEADLARIAQLVADYEEVRWSIDKSRHAGEET
jgi:hypothetical protein